MVVNPLTSTQNVTAPELSATSAEAFIGMALHFSFALSLCPTLLPCPHFHRSRYSLMSILLANQHLRTCSPRNLPETAGDKPYVEKKMKMGDVVGRQVSALTEVFRAGNMEKVGLEQR